MEALSCPMYGHCVTAEEESWDVRPSDLIENEKQKKSTTDSVVLFL